MMLHIRRVVTGHDADGKAVIIADGEAPRSWRRPSGLGQSLCWVTDTMPVDNTGHADGGDQDIGIPPPPHGSVFRIVEFPPEGDDLDHADPSGQAMLKAAGAIVKGDAGLTARHPGMHKTNTIDYAVILSGETDMLVDEDEVHLRAGDVVVQRGTYHAWANRGTEPCRIAFILIDAAPVP
jgi:mannose-6-phosphate isomerase-like protein (cupin superfamily)